MKVEMGGDGAANKRVGLELCKNMEIWRHGQSGRGLLGGYWGADITASATSWPWNLWDRGIERTIVTS